MARAGVLGTTAFVKTGHPPGSGGFDWIAVVLSVWFVGGIYLDGWAHRHVPQLESFFTPWHAVFYSAFLAVAGFLVAAAVRNHAQGYPWRAALPAGYELCLWGALIFAVGGVGDLLWHTLFGIEVDVEALLSPTHLLLALGLALIVTGPLRAGCSHSEELQNWLRRLPMVISLALVLSVLTFMTQYAHPLVIPWASFRIPEPVAQNTPVYRDIVFHHTAEGVLNVLVQTGLLMGLVLVTLRRSKWSLPWGSLTLLFTLNAAFVAVLDHTYRLIPVAVFGGIVADVLLHRLRPSPQRPSAVRLFAFLAPALLYLVYFLTLIITEGLVWLVHVWTGAIVQAGITGWLISYLVLAPQVQTAER